VPGFLYGVLPYPVQFHPYTPDKVVSALQLLLMTGVAFWFYLPKLKVERAISLDTDWFYRMFGKGVAWFCHYPANAFRSGVQREVRRGVDWIMHWSRNPYRFPKAIFSFLRGEAKGRIREIFHESYRVDHYRLPVGLTIGSSFLFLIFWGLLSMMAWG
jgi:hypothetical protein